VPAGGVVVSLDGRRHKFLVRLLTLLFHIHRRNSGLVLYLYVDWDVGWRRVARLLLLLTLCIIDALVHCVVHHASVERILLLGLLVLVGDDAASDDAQRRRILALPLLLGAAAAFHGRGDVLLLDVARRVLFHLLVLRHVGVLREPTAELRLVVRLGPRGAAVLLLHYLHVFELPRLRVLSWRVLVLLLVHRVRGAQGRSLVHKTHLVLDLNRVDLRADR
jgi:hypothetical protein